MTEQSEKSRVVIVAKQDDRLGDRNERVRVINAITSSGGRVRHDSGGRVLIIDTSGVGDEILDALPETAQLVSSDEDAADSTADLDPSDTLFVEAATLRNSAAYRSAKKKQKPGESPEEIELFSAGCESEE